MQIRAAFACFLVVIISLVTPPSAHACRAITILFTHDLHSYFLPHRETGNTEDHGGYARLATLIKEERKREGECLLVVDAGDFSMGTLFHTLFTREAAELMLMAEMGYDAITFGNHDFDFRLDGLAQALLLARSRLSQPPQMVASNVSFGPPMPQDALFRRAVEQYPVKPYTVITRGGIRIGIFGLLGRDAWDDAPFARPLQFSDPIVSAREITKSLKERENVDLVICLSHSGTSPHKDHSEDEHLARSVPDIDIIVSGHTHTVLPSPIMQGQTIIASAGRYGAYLGAMVVEVPGGSRPHLLGYRLIPVTDNIPEDPPIKARIATFLREIDSLFLAPYGTRYGDVIAEVGYDIDTLDQAYRRNGESGLGNLVTDAFRYAIAKAEGHNYTQIHLAIEPIGVIRSSFILGTIATSDIFRVLSLGLGPDGTPGYPLLTTYLTGKDVKRLLEVETTVARMKRDAHLQVSGVRCTYNPHRLPFDRVMSLALEERDGTYRSVDPARLYRVAMNYYCAQMVDYISRVSHGLLVVTPRDRSGHPVSRIEDGIVRVPTGKGGGELKEWQALALYLRSFSDEDGNGLPEVPLRYQHPEGRIKAIPSWYPRDLTCGATAITWLTLAITLILVLVAVAAISYILKRILLRKTERNLHGT